GKLDKYLADPARKLARGEAGELRKQVETIVEALEDFPLLGEAGQPGYLIVSLTDLEGVKTIQTLSTSQRESLERDWKAGRKFLEAHRDYLRTEVQAMKRRGWFNRLVRAARAYLNEKPVC